MMQAPDYTIKSTVADILNYIPGPTGALLAFLIFGTTEQLRPRYASIFAHLCCCGRTQSSLPCVERPSDSDWSRVTSQELRDGQQIEMLSVDLQGVDPGSQPRPDSGAAVVVHGDIQVLPETYKQVEHHQRRPSRFEE